MPDQIEMPARVRKYLMDNFSEIEIDEFKIIKVLGSGNTAVTYEVEDQNGLPWALKVVKRESYGDRAPFREIGRFARAKDKRFLVFPEDVGDHSLKLGSKTYDFIWFKSRCVEGQTLKSYFESKTQFSAKTEILRYIENITAALDELQRLKFCHGDLHDRNIMREVIGEEGLLPEIRYVIIDFSEAHPIDDPREGLSKDFENFGKHLRSFSEAVYRRESLTREDEKILTAISHIPGLLNGTAPESMCILRASQIAEIFKVGLRSTEQNPFGEI